MTVSVVVGTQFGDEGKGKIVDLLASDFDVIARFNGGANAGHTVVVGDESFAFRLLPSGAIRGKQVAIGNGVVVDPDLLIKEIDEIEARTSQEVKLWLSDRAHVVMPYHKTLDGAEKRLKGDLSSGSTRRGIGPCYGDKITRVGIRIGDLTDRKLLEEKLKTYLPLKKKILDAFGLELDVSREGLVEWCLSSGERLAKYIADTSVSLNAAVDEGKDLLLEGAQGTHLDIDHGVYPFGTSSNPTAGGACTGTGLSPRKIDEVVGIVKAYTSRVGEGPFPTEIMDSTADEIREKGGEYGTVTKRPRRCGWLDLVMVGYSARVNGLSGLALTKLDVLGGFSEIEVCVAYEIEGREITEFPANISSLSAVRPVYETLPGWEYQQDEEWKRICQDGYDELPGNVRRYVEYVEKQLGTRVEIVSVGKDRDATIRR